MQQKPDQTIMIMAMSHCNSEVQTPATKIVLKEVDLRRGRERAMVRYGECGEQGHNQLSCFKTSNFVMEIREIIVTRNMTLEPEKSTGGGIFIPAKFGGSQSDATTTEPSSVGNNGPFTCFYFKVVDMWWRKDVFGPVPFIDSINELGLYLNFLHLNSNNNLFNHRCLMSV
ncbi:uncharacterized protein LOC131610498 [Vicia villosa]|uniref:uncharacterized protein LOC131610498 n=1 Tax=Vicia villosa TaxID=3911 RepID=UPI00273C2491|nr:uncharacterized protein LOC131610498 [Vicia villosa]XP_058738443.1 uncharacterized protein LOC131610498 [Vicia villosa]XP_058738444.1 uncharacterized protein LOC131610498 [Vicia villosa]XP_058738445.1 uncharacterized protein LOC131610498 [Vicia villosa]